MTWGAVSRVLALVLILLMLVFFSAAILIFTHIPFTLGGSTLPSNLTTLLPLFFLAFGVLNAILVFFEIRPVWLAVAAIVEQNLPTFFTPRELDMSTMLMSFILFVGLMFFRRLFEIVRTIQSKKDL